MLSVSAKGSFLLQIRLDGRLSSTSTLLLKEAKQLLAFFANCLATSNRVGKSLLIPGVLEAIFSGGGSHFERAPTFVRHLIFCVT